MTLPWVVVDSPAGWLTGLKAQGQPIASLQPQELPQPCRVQHAKARFSELLDACVREGPQVVSLLDTNVASELRKPRPHGAVLAWLDGVDDANLHLASLSYNVLAMDGPALRCWARLMHRLGEPPRSSSRVDRRIQAV